MADEGAGWKHREGCKSQSMNIQRLQQGRELVQGLWEQHRFCFANPTTPLMGNAGLGGKSEYCECNACVSKVSAEWIHLNGNSSSV